MGGGVVRGMAAGAATRHVTKGNAAHDGAARAAPSWRARIQRASAFSNCALLIDERPLMLRCLASL